MPPAGRVLWQGVDGEGSCGHLVLAVRQRYMPQSFPNRKIAEAKIALRSFPALHVRAEVQSISRQQRLRQVHLLALLRKQHSAGRQLQHHQTSSPHQNIKGFGDQVCELSGQQLQQESLLVGHGRTRHDAVTTHLHVKLLVTRIRIAHLGCSARPT